MKLRKKLFALGTAFVMALSVTACVSDGETPEQTTNGTDSTSTASNLSNLQSGEKIELEEIGNIVFNLHYFRDDGNYDGWNAWIWTGGEGKSYQFDTEAGDKGMMTSVELPVDATSIGFIIRLNEWEAKDPDGDRFIDISDVIEGTVNVYASTGKSEFEIEFGDDVSKGPKVLSAALSDDLMTVEFELSAELTSTPEDFIMIINDENYTINIEKIEVDGTAGSITLSEPADLMQKYSIVLDSKYKFSVRTPDVFSTADFENEYTYTGNDLGAEWTAEKTLFRVWAPTASEVKVKLYESGDKASSDEIETIIMTPDVNGTWTTEKTGDLNGIYYTYLVTINGAQSEACDPYAKAVGVNGDRAMVIDLASTNPNGWENDKNPNTSTNITDAVIYELHVRDLSSDTSSGITNAGKYLGIIEDGTVNSNGIMTGLDYIKDLGITHLHLNPVYDYATVDETKLDTEQFNWGYDPKNYNVPEGSYSTDPYNGEVRISEFKQMVKGLHDNGISVVMDVVYNHTYSTDYCFNSIVPGYFYRYNEDGSLSSGSGCGNDTASERSMVRKFIVDSVVYWATEYHIDGFRFDLMGLHDVDTMNAVRAALDEIDPSIIVYGEGWVMDSAVSKPVSMANQINAKKMPGIAMFSDNIRDAIKGSVFDAYDKGYVNGVYTRIVEIKDGVLGLPTWANSPTSVITYSSSHDNNTLWDTINTSNADDTYEDRVKQSMLAGAIIYTAQGTPFMLAGEEMLRTKVKDDGTFDHNSYASSDAVNSIKWDTLNDASVMSVRDYYKGLIEFRKAHSALRMTEQTWENTTFSEGLDEGVMAFLINKANGEVSDGIFVIYNPTRGSTEVVLPDGDWNVCIEGDKAGTDVIKTISGSVTVDAISCTVLVKA